MVEMEAPLHRNLRPGTFPKVVAFWTFCACFRPDVRLSESLSSLEVLSLFLDGTSASSISPRCLPAALNEKTASGCFPIMSPRPCCPVPRLCAPREDPHLSGWHLHSFLANPFFFFGVGLSLTEAQPESLIQWLLAPRPATAHVHSLPGGKCD